MDQEHFIRTLSLDDRRPAPMGQAWALALAAAVLVAAGLFATILGPRPDIATAAETWRFLYKFLVTAVLFLTGLWALLALARPGARARLPLLLLAPALLLASVLVELVVAPAGELGSRLVGNNALLCLTFIPLIGAGPLAAFLLALRHGAPDAPARAGAVAGLVAGGLAATLYASHCTDDSPLFVATWYPLAVLLLAAVGALAGRRLARW
ncbi:NrsF family protein [Mesorhizobium marinum]|uniref:NrsF family protein n=1 Tax=Mesorhizobium marinum TaxID=3228790 RepID=A0ABV3R204_9HYPH